MFMEWVGAGWFSGCTLPTFYQLLQNNISRTFTDVPNHVLTEGLCLVCPRSAKQSEGRDKLGLWACSRMGRFQEESSIQLLQGRQQRNWRRAVD